MAKGKVIEMCRSIKQLRRAERPATEEEIQAAALQFVRKLSGFRKPPRANQGFWRAGRADPYRDARNAGVMGGERDSGLEQGL